MSLSLSPLKERENVSNFFSLSFSLFFSLSLERESPKSRDRIFFNPKFITFLSQSPPHFFFPLFFFLSLSLLKDEVNDDEEYDEYSNTIAVATLFLSSSSSSLSLLKDEVNDDDEYYS
tara:strand:- start:31 stop:384 length:354 start_codon:yes stop_codon:yes gene_type:complete